MTDHDPRKKSGNWMHEEPSSAHAKQVMNAVAPLLKEYRNQRRRIFFSWAWLAGGSFAAAGLAAIFFLRREIGTNSIEHGGLAIFAELDFSIESESEIDDATLITSNAGDIEFDALADLDLLSEVTDEELSS